MPIYLASSDPLAVWGQIAAIILLLYLLVFIVIGLVLGLVLLLGMSWVREKIELIKLIRPVVNRRQYDHTVYYRRYPRAAQGG